MEQQYKTDYIRVTREPVTPYLAEVGLWKTYKPVNWIKNLLLNFYASGMEKTIERSRPSWQSENRLMFLWGVVMSGRMDCERVHILLDRMKKKAVKKERHLEILFHPGRCV